MRDERWAEWRADQREYFDELIGDWAAYEDPEWDAARAREVAWLLGVARPTRVLDVGCGCGYHDLLLARDPGVAEVVGIDYSPRSVEEAERRYPHPRVRRLVADVYDLDDRDFDLVTSFQVIEHVDDPAGFLATCAHLARSGGVVAAFTPNRLRLANRLRAAAGRPHKLEDPQHHTELTPEELDVIARRLGLTPVGRLTYGLGLSLPRVGRLPRGRAYLRGGQVVGALADRFGAAYRVP